MRLLCSRLLFALLVFLLTLSVATEDEDEHRLFYQPAQLDEFFTDRCETECWSTLDCSVQLSCFGATVRRPGCCLPALRPNETGCVLDEQCKRACELSVCQKSNDEKSGGRCLCEPGHHFLFNKCWKQCPDFAHPTPKTDATGFSWCELRVDPQTAALHFRRHRRQLRDQFC